MTIIIYDVTATGFKGAIPSLPCLNGLHSFQLLALCFFFFFLFSFFLFFSFSSFFFFFLSFISFLFLFSFFLLFYFSFFFIFPPYSDYFNIFYFLELSQLHDHVFNTHSSIPHTQISLFGLTLSSSCFFLFFFQVIFFK